MSEDKSPSLVPTISAFMALAAALKAEMELAGGLGLNGKMALASLGALHTEISELIVLVEKPAVIPEEAVQNGLLQRYYISQFDQDELGLRIAALEQAAEELFAVITRTVLQQCQVLEDPTETSLLTADSLRTIARISRTLSIHRTFAPALQSQIKALANAIRVLRLETLAASLALVEAPPAS